MGPSLIDRLAEETRDLHGEANSDVQDLLGFVTPAKYGRYLARVFGFLRPLEMSLSKTPGLDRILDARRLRKHELLGRDLEFLGLKHGQIEALPQYAAIPLFETPQEALGWAYLIERSTLEHHNLFHHLAMVMPGTVAFTSSYLKCYFGAVSEMWNGFGDALNAAVLEPHHDDVIVDAAKAAFRHNWRWRNTLDGKSTSAEHPRGTELTGPKAPVAEAAAHDDERHIEAE